MPGNDPTLLFTNSGMVQFKDVFLGTDKRPYVRAASAQALPARRRQAQRSRERRLHRTPPHVLRDARQLELRRLLQARSDPLRVGIADQGTTDSRRDRLWATVYIDDDEAYDIWTRDIGIAARTLHPHRRQQGRASTRATTSGRWPTPGPCGPCSEIFYDHGPDVFGGPPGSPDAEGDRYIEIWNLVFMQFNRQRGADGYTMTPLPKPCVDTGMGLERLAAVLQHVHSNYEIDLFVALIAAAARETRTSDLDNPSLKVIADHIRACAFLIVDGVIPGQRGPRLRAAPHRPPRDPPWLPARAEAAVLPQARRGSRPPDGRRVSASSRATRRASPRC